MKSYPFFTSKKKEEKKTLSFLKNKINKISPVLNLQKIKLKKNKILIGSWKDSKLWLLIYFRIQSQLFSHENYGDFNIKKETYLVIWNFID